MKKKAAVPKEIAMTESAAAGMRREGSKRTAVSTTAAPAAVMRRLTFPGIKGVWKIIRGDACLICLKVIDGLPGSVLYRLTVIQIPHIEEVVDSDFISQFSKIVDNRQDNLFVYGPFLLFICIQ